MEPMRQMLAMQAQFAEVRKGGGRAQILAALSPQHRAAVASAVSALTLSANPDPHAAAQALDVVLTPAEKTSIVNIDAAQRASFEALMEQQMAAFALTLPAASL
jgi:hypothetical protein